MSVTSSPPPITGAPRSAVIRERLSSTPGRLLTWSLLLSLLTVGFGLAGSAAINARIGAIGDTRAAASRLGAIQTARTAAVEADSIATTSFLVGGLEDPARRATYERRLARSVATLSSIGGDSRTRRALAEAGSALNRYAGLVEQARANNRQGLPVGAAYQRQASALMRDAIVTQFDEIDRLVRAEINRSFETSRTSILWLHGFGLASVGAILVGSVWLARRTNRRLNLGLIGALALVVVAWGVGGTSARNGAVRAEDTARGPLTQFDQLGQGRSAGFDARSLEALTLIARGSGAAYQARWQSQAALAERLLGARCNADSSACASLKAFGAYATEHAKVRALDEAGNWDGAVAAALGTADPNAAATTTAPTGEAANSARAFEAFDAESARATTAAANSADLGFADALDAPAWTRWLVLAAGLAAAALIIAGYNPRLKEYR